MTGPAPLRSRQRLGKYRIEGRIGEGGSSMVYRAYDTIEGIRVALKIPLDQPEILELFQREVRIMAKLDHPNILLVKNASFIDDRFVIATPLAEESLADRLARRTSLETLITYAQQLVQALSYAHSRSILHGDIKPENVLLFPEQRLRLSDFGVARVARSTLRASGSGTLGSMAPEQAMGRPSLRSDVFALGLVLYRMFAGQTPEWPFEWPLPGNGRLVERMAPEFVFLIRKALELQPKNRFADGVELAEHFEAIGPEIDAHIEKQRRRARRARRKKAR